MNEGMFFSSSKTCMKKTHPEYYCFLNRIFCLTDFRAQLLGPTNFPLHLTRNCNFDLDVHFISQLDSDEEISEEMSNDNVGRKPNTLEMTPSELRGLSGINLNTEKRIFSLLHSRPEYLKKSR